MFKRGKNKSWVYLLNQNPLLKLISSSWAITLQASFNDIQLCQGWLDVLSSHIPGTQNVLSKTVYIKHRQNILLSWKEYL